MVDWGGNKDKERCMDKGKDVGLPQDMQLVCLLHTQLRNVKALLDKESGTKSNKNNGALEWMASGVSFVVSVVIQNYVTCLSRWHVWQAEGDSCVDGKHWRFYLFSNCTHLLSSQESLNLEFGDMLLARGDVMHAREDSATAGAWGPLGLASVKKFWNT